MDHSTRPIDRLAPPGDRSFRRRIVVVGRLVALVGLAAAFAVPAARGAESSGPRIVGHLERFAPDVAAAFGVADLKKSTQTTVDNGLALQYPEFDRLYQLYNLTAGPNAGGLGIVERDRGSLEMLRSVVVPKRHAEMANGANGAEWVATFDHRNHRLHIAYGSTGGFGGAPGQLQGQNLPGIVSVDLKSLAFKDNPFPRLTVEGADLVGVPAGIEFDESTNTLLMLQAANHGTQSLANALFLVGWTAAELQKGAELPAVPPRPVRSCRRDPVNDATNRYLTPILISPAPDIDGDGAVKTFVMFPCYATTFSTNVVIARIERATALDPTSRQERAVVSPSAVINWATDSVHGRMFLTNSSAETDTWVYEAASNAFVGIIEMSPKGKNIAGELSLGVDEVSGRLYARAQGNGLMITPAAQDPVPQADIYPELAATGSYRILPDEKRDRLFSLPGTSTGISNASDRYDIIAVPPPVAPAPPENPDARTAQIDEQPGKTVAQYGGNATAYGLRVLLARGISGAIPSNGNDTAGDVYKNVDTYCGFTDRELVVAGIGKTELSDLSRFAVASAIELDSATVTDLKIPSRCDIYNSYSGAFYPATAVAPFLQTVGVLNDADSKAPPGAQPSPVINTVIGPRTTWDYVAADCSRTNGVHATGPNSEKLAGPTKVDCTKEASISAQAEGRARELDGTGVTVGKATSSTRVFIDPKRGLVSTSTSRVENVRIGEISIGYISNTATSMAKGRAGTAKTEFSKPSIGFVQGPGVPACTDQCDVDAVIKQLNTVVSGRAEFRRPPPETRLAGGSPGGYEAGILKSEKQKASDNSLSGDKSVEIPALELVIYNDNSVIGRARQVFQFAGVRVDSHYGIQSISEGTGCLTCGGVTGATLDELGDVVTLPDELPAIAASSNPPAGAASKSLSPAARIGDVVRKVAAGVAEGFRLIFSNPREAMAMGTAWLLLLGPFGAAARRRALRQLTDQGTASP